MVCSFTCPGVETRTYVATRMVLLLTVRVRSVIVGFSLQSPLQDVLVGSIPTLACIRALCCLSADSPLVFHVSLRTAQLRAEGKLDLNPSSYARHSTIPGKSYAKNRVCERVFAFCGFLLRVFRPHSN